MKFSKVRSVLSVYSKFGSELTFEDVYLVHASGVAGPSITVHVVEAIVAAVRSIVAAVGAAVAGVSGASTTVHVVVVGVEVAVCRVEVEGGAEKGAKQFDCMYAVDKSDLAVGAGGGSCRVVVVEGGGVAEGVGRSIPFERGGEEVVEGDVERVVGEDDDDNDKGSAEPVVEGREVCVDGGAGQFVGGSDDKVVEGGVGGREKGARLHALICALGGGDIAEGASRFGLGGVAAAVCVCQCACMYVRVCMYFNQMCIYMYKYKSIYVYKVM